jgi:SAM-dependent methyltransferase
MNRCRVCDASGDFTVITAREKMFGTGEAFDYFLCADCGCLQIGSPPTDMARHYPADYYSQSRDSALKRWLKGQRIKAGLGERSAAGRWAIARFGVDSTVEALRAGHLQRGDGILDVGSGDGRNLWPLAAAGFRNLTGVDPYLLREVRRPGMTLRRDWPGEGTFRLVMYHHAFEHLEDPHAELTRVKAALAPDGLLLIRVPVLGYGWHTYGTDWVELDAPRHFYLHTPASLVRLLQRHGFSVLAQRFDSTALEIWGSEQYRRGIAHRAANSYDVNPARSMFTAAQIAAWSREIEAQNAGGTSGRLSVTAQLQR